MLDGMVDRGIELIPQLSDFVSGSLAAGLVYTLATGAAIWGGKWGLRSGDTRKVFHLFVFSGAAGICYLDSISAVVVYGCWGSILILVAVLRGARSRLFQAIARREDGDSQKHNVLLSLSGTAAGGIVAHLLVGHSALIGFLVTGLGDALGEPIGKRWGKHQLHGPSKLVGSRTLEGSLAVLAGSLLAALLGLALEGSWDKALLTQSFVVAVGASLVEAISPRGTDNFTIQVAVALILLGR